MVFCNTVTGLKQAKNKSVTILILIDGFLQSESIGFELPDGAVTILILIDGFLQYSSINMVDMPLSSHNPYFNRWFSAM